MAGRQMQSILADRVVPMQQLKAVSDLYAVNIVDTVHKARAGTVSPAQALEHIRDGQGRHRQDLDRLQRHQDDDRGKRPGARRSPRAFPPPRPPSPRWSRSCVPATPPRWAPSRTRELYPAIDPVTANVAALVDLQTRVAHEDAAAAAKVFNLSMTIMGIIALAAVGLLAFAANVILNKVSAPLAAMTTAMRRLAGGDNAIEIPAAGRQDELGEMAGAVAVFRDAAIAKLKADAEVIEAKTRAERERVWPPARPRSPSSRPWWSPPSGWAWRSWPRAT